MQLTESTSSAYAGQSTFYVAVDCIILGLCGDALSVMLSRRDFEPRRGTWSLMGGFVRAGETVDDAARRVLFDITGLDDDAALHQIGAFGDIDRDPGARVISVAYYALVDAESPLTERSCSRGAQWFAIDSAEMPDLGFDHAKMITQARSMLRQRMATEPIGMRMLPAVFTLRRLQSLYEAVYGENLDKRNFRKRIAVNPCIVSTDSLDRTSSRRGAQLYRFSEEVYRTDPRFRV